MSNSTRSLIIAAAAASMFLAGCATQGTTDTTMPAAPAVSQNSCKGMSSCKGMTSCKTAHKAKKHHKAMKKAAPAASTSTTTTTTTTDAATSN